MNKVRLGGIILIYYFSGYPYNFFPFAVCSKMGLRHFDKNSLSESRCQCDLENDIQAEQAFTKNVFELDQQQYVILYLLKSLISYNFENKIQNLLSI